MCACVSCTKNMAKMMSMLLMVVMLGVFIHSSQALKCYVCAGCDSPTGSCDGEVCIKSFSETPSAFTIYSILIYDDKALALIVCCCVSND